MYLYFCVIFLKAVYKSGEEFGGLEFHKFVFKNPNLICSMEKKMLPITRVNLNNICCTCLMDVRRTKFTKDKVHVINKDPNLLKMLQETAYATVLKDIKNLKFTGDYSQKLCQRCFSKAKDSYHLLEKVRQSSARLKDLLLSDLDTSGTEMKKLKNCCRICLIRQRGQKYHRREKYKKYLKWLQDFGGIEDEEQLTNNKPFPKQLCITCMKKIYIAEKYLLLSTFAFEYIASEIDKECRKSQNINKDTGDNVLPQKELIVDESLTTQNFNKDVQEEVFMIKYEEEGTQYQETVILNNKVFEIKNLPKDSNEQKDGKNHFTDISVYSTAIEGLSSSENQFSLKKEEYEDVIDCDFVVIDAEQ